jgi:hypothetical protein
VLLSDVASALRKQWAQRGNENHLVRPAPAAEFDSLRNVVKAHIALDKAADAGAENDLEWWPTAFIVEVREDWRTNSGGLLFVFADEEKDHEMDRFFFQAGGCIHDAFELELWRRGVG